MKSREKKFQSSVFSCFSFSKSLVCTSRIIILQSFFFCCALLFFVDLGKMKSRLMFAKVSAEKTWSGLNPGDDVEHQWSVVKWTGNVDPSINFLLLFFSYIYSRRWQKNAKVANERGWCRGKTKINNSTERSAEKTTKSEENDQAESIVQCFSLASRNSGRSEGNGMKCIQNAMR